MGIIDIQGAFNEAAGSAANCVKALMDYKQLSGIEMQILFFSGNFADGTEFVVQSEPVRPSGDLLAAARTTALNMLQKRNQS